MNNRAPFLELFFPAQIHVILELHCIYFKEITLYNYDLFHVCAVNFFSMILQIMLHIFYGWNS
jgi:hypothetical protein